MTSHNNPTIFHITHWKAGSQWIHKILRSCVPELIITPQIEVAHFLKSPIQKGKIYPTVYVTKEQFDNVTIPSTWIRFIIIRDLRDTLVSAYFSFKISHPLIAPKLTNYRLKLESLNLEDGLLFLMDEWLPDCASIQKSWLNSTETLIRYEDILVNDLEIFERVLIDYCQLPIPRGKIKEAILANRFESISMGRKRGQEDINAHERKGIAGDWRNYFSPKVKEKFKNIYGDLVIKTGYEKDFKW